MPKAIFQHKVRYFHMAKSFGAACIPTKESYASFNGREIFQKEREDKASRSSGNGTIEAIRQLRAEGLEAEESVAAFVAAVR